MVRFLRIAHKEQVVHRELCLTLFPLLHPSCFPPIQSCWWFTKQSADSRLSAFVRAVPSATVPSPTYLTHLENCCLSLKTWSKGLLCKILPDIFMQRWSPSLSFSPTILSLYFIISLVLPVSSWAEIREILWRKESGRIRESRENGNEALDVSCDCHGLSSGNSNEDEKGTRVKISFESTVDRIFWLAVVGERKGEIWSNP